MNMSQTSYTTSFAWAGALLASLLFVLATCGSVIYVLLTPMPIDTTSNTCQPNLTLAIQKQGHVQLYKPKVAHPMYQRHVILVNVTREYPGIVTLMRDADMHTVFLMRISIETSGKGEPYVSMLLR